MSFDPSRTDLARAHRAIERLRAVRQRLARERADHRLDRYDIPIRAALLAIIASLMVVAFIRL